MNLIDQVEIKTVDKKLRIFKNLSEAQKFLSTVRASASRLREIASEYDLRLDEGIVVALTEKLPEIRAQLLNLEPVAEPVADVEPTIRYSHSAPPREDEGWIFVDEYCTPLRHSSRHRRLPVEELNVIEGFEYLHVSALARVFQSPKYEQFREVVEDLVTDPKNNFNAENAEVTSSEIQATLTAHLDSKSHRRTVTVMQYTGILQDYIPNKRSFGVRFWNLRFWQKKFEQLTGE